MLQFNTSPLEKPALQGRVLGFMALLCFTSQDFTYCVGLNKHVFFTLRTDLFSNNICFQCISLTGYSSHFMTSNNVLIKHIGLFSEATAWLPAHVSMREHGRAVSGGR